MTMLVCSVSIHTEVRSRLSLEFVEQHTSHGQLITGTPCEVPVPKNVIFTAKYPFGFVRIHPGFEMTYPVTGDTISAFRRSAPLHLW